MSSKIEHFVTLFDSRFLPLGMAQHESLARLGVPFRLWVICMDDEVHGHLSRLALPDLVPLRLADAETEGLLAVKPLRSHREYCWNLTPFAFDAVFDRAAEASRVTYLDADVFFYDDPRLLLDGLDDSGRHVLVTEHAYAPEYDQTATSGRFCVQFLTFDRSDEARRVKESWQGQCLDACQEVSADGRFGDQMYLDDWPDRFGDVLHIVGETHRTLAPWNVRHVVSLDGGPPDPVFYHFHGFRVFRNRRARLFEGYRIGSEGLRLYDTYVASVGRALDRMAASDIAVDFDPAPPRTWRDTRRALRGKVKFAALR